MNFSIVRVPRSWWDPRYQFTNNKFTLENNNFICSVEHSLFAFLMKGLLVFACFLGHSSWRGFGFQFSIWGWFIGVWKGREIFEMKN
jgi:hypothetical protein